MKITRERYLDDSDRWRLTLDLVSGTPEMHSALDALSADVRDELGDVLVNALTRAARIVEPVAVERGARPVHVEPPRSEGGPSGPRNPPRKRRAPV